MEFGVGAIVDGKVTGITKFGAFVSLPDGKSGLVHISEIAYSYVNEVSDHLREGQEVKVKVIGVEPSGAASMKASVEAGHVVTLDRVTTIADGVAVKTPGDQVFPYIQRNVDELLTIDDDELVDAFLDVMEKHKMVVENAGLLTIAALKHLDCGDCNVVSVLSGGNMDVITISSLVQHGLINRGRIFTFSVQLPDRPGELLRIAGLVAGLNGNIIKLDHNQFVNINRQAGVELKVTMEAFGLSHKAEILDALRQAAGEEIGEDHQSHSLNIGVSTSPELMADDSDRNRTSPFAFTGNRFEFRALGSGMPASASQTALNTMMADSLDYAATRLEKLCGGDPEKLHVAVTALIQEIMEEHSAVIFNGDGYSEIWHQEAERRGLPNYRTTPEALLVYTSPEVIDLYGRYKVLSRQELKARQEIYIEQYCKSIRAEANLAARMGRTIIYPAGLRFQQELLRACLDMRALNREPDTVLLDDVDATLRSLREALEHLERLMDTHYDDLVLEAHHYCTAIIPTMNMIRSLADHLETVVPEDLWPLPSYQEMLFVK